MAYPNLSFPASTNRANGRRARCRDKRRRVRPPLVEQSRHQSISHDRRIAEQRCWIVPQFSGDVISSSPLLPDADPPIDLRVSTLRVETVDVPMAQFI